MDNQHLTHYTPDKMADTYYILDTTVPPTRSADVDAMNGRQGDDMRAIPIAFTDDGQPHDLTNTSITLKVLDAEGVVKVSDKVIRMVDATGGLVLFGVPAKVYQSIGQVQRAYFVLKDKTAEGDNQVISTVNVSFYVMENGIDLTQADNTTYVSKLDGLLDKTDSLATLNADNKFTGSNSFKSIHVDSLSAPVVDSLSSAATSASDGLSSLTSTVSSAATSASTGLTSLSESLSAVTSSVATVSSTASANSSAITSLSAALEDLPSSSSADSGNNYGDMIERLQSTIADLSDTVNNQNGSITAASSAAFAAQQTATSASAQVYQVSMAASNASYAADSAGRIANENSQAISSLVTKLKMLSINV